MSLVKIHESLKDFELDSKNGFWSVVTPEPVPSVNMLWNPSFETNPSGDSDIVNWTQYQGGFRGMYAVGFNDTTQALHQIVYANARRIVQIASNSDYTWSFYLIASVGETLNISASIVTATGQSSVSLGTAVIVASSAYWTRYSLSFHTPTSALIGATTVVTLSIQRQSTTAPVSIIRVDAMQLEPTAYMTSYFDGDQSGCNWVGVANKTPSLRAAMSAGGREYSFKSLGFRIYNYQGAGSSDFEEITQQLGQLPGRVLQAQNAKERQVTLIGVITKNDLRSLEQSRESLIEALVNDGTTPNKVLTLKRQLYVNDLPAGKTLEMKVVYIGGLEGSTDNLYKDQIALKFSEFGGPVGWQELEENAVALNPNQFWGGQSFSALMTFVRDLNGNWYSPLSGSIANVENDVIYQGYDGYIYYGGAAYAVRVRDQNFLPSLSSSPNQSSIATVNNNVYAFEQSSQTLKVLIGGSFTTPYANIFEYDPSTGTSANIINSSTSAVISFNNTVRTICTLGDGTTWFGGDFTAPGTRLIVLSADRATVTNLNANGTIYKIIRYTKTSVVVVGDFTSINGVTCNRVAIVSINPTTVNILGVGLDSTVYTAAFGSNGNIYVGGSFLTAGGINAMGIAAWNGFKWQALNVGPNVAGTGQQVRALAFDSLGRLLVAGIFYTTLVNGSYPTSTLAIYSNGYWLPVDNDFSTGTVITSAIISQDGRYFVGAPFAGQQYYSGASTAVDCTKSSLATKFRIALVGVGRLVKIANQTTGAELFFNYSFGAASTNTVIVPEILTITVDGINVTVVSNVSGNITGAILPGSRLRDFILKPGVINYFSMYVAKTVTNTTSTIYYRNTHNSVDGETKNG